MSQTLFSFYAHIIFSTKNRLNLIPDNIEEELYSYIGGIVKNQKCVLLEGNGTKNHIHLLVSIDRNVLIPDLVGKIKRDSTKWIKQKDVRYTKFQWQEGYAAFSVGHTQLEAVKKYIINQKAHHTQIIFEDEIRIFLKKYSIEYKEEYLWD